MRSLSLLLLFISVCLSYAQDSEIISIQSDSRILRGRFGEEFAFTMYLNVAQASDNIGYIYSVNGWYQYNSIGTPIPVVGIWTGSELHLFVSNDSKFMKNFAEFTYENEEGVKYLDNFIYDLETFTVELPEITERFYLSFEEHGIYGDWKSNDKSYKVSINGKNNQIFREAKYLKLPNEEYFDLSNLGVPARANFEIEAMANGSKNILLHYTYQANLNYMGRCGGAENSGKIGLVFNDEFQLAGYTQLELMDCYQELSIEDLEKVSESVTKYIIYNYNSSNKEAYMVDFVNATVKKMKK